MKRNPGKYLLVLEDILPEAIRKTARAKELLARGDVHTVNEAVEQVELSRSAFYKYKDGVFPFYEAGQQKIITISLIMDHTSGVLSTVLNTIAKGKGNILTINQGLPLQNMANASISIETANMEITMDEMFKNMEQIPGVKKVELVGQS